MRRLLSELGRAALLIGIATTVPGGARAQDCVRDRQQVAVQARVTSFLEKIGTVPPDSLIGFFPTLGEFTYRLTQRSSEGSRVAERRFQASEALGALTGPLWSSFTINYERQPIGRFAHQLMLRPGRWRHVGRNRFVPSGADADSGIFVQWRLEGSEWVISELGDEHYESGELPEWCC